MLSYRFVQQFREMVDIMKRMLYLMQDFKAKPKSRTRSGGGYGVEQKHSLGHYWLRGCN